MTVFTLSSELQSLSNQPQFDGTSSLARLSCGGGGGLLCSRSKSQRGLKFWTNVCSDDNFWTTEPMHHRPESHVERLVCSLPSKGHSEASYCSNMTVFTITSKLLILLRPDLVWLHIISSQTVWQKDWIIVFSVQGQGSCRGSTFSWMFVLSFAIDLSPLEVPTCIGDVST